MPVFVGAGTSSFLKGDGGVGVFYCHYNHKKCVVGGKTWSNKFLIKLLVYQNTITVLIGFL